MAKDDTPRILAQMDHILNHTQEMCKSFRTQGFGNVAEYFSETFALYYDQILPYLADNSYDGNPEVQKIIAKMEKFVKALDQLTGVVAFCKEARKELGGPNGQGRAR